MTSFNYHSPAAAGEAVNAATGSDDKRYLAGGMSLIPSIKQRLLEPTDLISLDGIADLAGIRQDGNNIVIGAMTTHAEVAASELVKSTIPALADLANDIGDPQVRNRGTIGGSIANADPAADYPAAVLGLNATITTHSRSIAADDFFTDLFETALADGELVTSVSFPIADSAAYEKFDNPASRYAIVGVMVARTGGGVRVAVTGAGAIVFRVAEMESALAGSFNSDSVTSVVIDATDLNDDIHASSEYRASLVPLMAGRAVASIV